MLLSKLCESINHRRIGADLEIGALEYDRERSSRVACFAALSVRFQTAMHMHRRQ